MGKVLLYNVGDTEKRMKIKLCLFRQGLTCVDVPAESFGHPLGYLLGLEGFAPGETGEPFTEEMLIMHGLSGQQFSALLDSLRQQGVPVALKAVVTDSNVHWSSSRLHRELAAEHAAMRKKAKSIHHKKGKR